MSAPAAQTQSTRDQLIKIVDLGQRALRYWAIAVAITLIGAGLSFMVAMRSPRKYESGALLLYYEQISQSALQGREVLLSSERKQSDRFEQMLLARSNLAGIVEELGLFPGLVDRKGASAAAMQLRSRIHFAHRGAGTFQITYTGDSPKQAQQVASRLASSLVEQDERLRIQLADKTRNFLEKEKDVAIAEQKQREVALAEFLANHPEFIDDGQGGETQGAGIKAAQSKKGFKSQGTSQLGALQRQRRRIQARLDNPTAVVPAPVATTRDSAARREAKLALADALRDKKEKEKTLQPKHPDMISAVNALEAAQASLRRVEAEEGVATTVEAAPINTEFDRQQLEKALVKLDAEIAQLQAREAGQEVSQKTTDLLTEVVGLETTFATLSREVDVGRDRIEQLESRFFSAQLTANSEVAESAQLQTIDDAYVPTSPSGKGRGIVAMAGTLAFAALGFVVAFSLGLLDDRVLRRQNIDSLGIAPVLVVIPKAPTPSRSTRKKAKRVQHG